MVMGSHVDNQLIFSFYFLGRGKGISCIFLDIPTIMYSHSIWRSHSMKSN